MSWKGIVNVTFPSHLQTLMALFPKSKDLKGLVSRSVKKTEIKAKSPCQSLKSLTIINENRNIKKHKHSVIQNIVSSKSWGAKGMGGKRHGGQKARGQKAGGQKAWGAKGRGAKGRGAKDRGQKTGGQKTRGQKTGGQKSCHPGV